MELSGDNELAQSSSPYTSRELKAGSYFAFLGESSKKAPLTSHPDSTGGEAPCVAGEGSLKQDGRVPELGTWFPK